MEKKQVSKLEYWRVRRGLSYADLGRLLGTSRQYAMQLSVEGLHGAELVFKLFKLTDGYIRPEDLIPTANRGKLEKEGLLPAQKAFDGEEDLQV